MKEGNREEGTGNRVEEVVFPGCHSDVGGLYDDNHAIADVTLDRILDLVKRALEGIKRHSLCDII